MDKPQTEAKSLVELAMPAIQQAIQQALMRHRLLGESIVIMRDGEIVTLTGDEIPVSGFNLWSLNPMPSLNEIQAQVQALKPVLQETYQVAQVGIFGSYVRGEQTPNSDLDILVEFLPDARFGLTKFCELEDYLGDALGLKVDLVMKTGLKTHIGDRILQEVIYL